MTEKVSLQAHVKQLVEKHGGLRKAARALQIDPGYLSRLCTGEKKHPEDKVLRRLGLRMVVHYELKVENHDSPEQ